MAVCLRVFAEMKAVVVLVATLAMAAAHICMVSPRQRGTLQGLDKPGELYSLHNLAILLSANVLLFLSQVQQTVFACRPSRAEGRNPTGIPPFSSANPILCSCTCSYSSSEFATH